MLRSLSLLLMLALKGLSADEVPNVALEGVASQSTTLDKYGHAGNAIDGSPSSDYMQGKCSHTGLDINPWWTVDLRARFEVFRIKIINRGDCCEERINGAEIRIGNSLRRDGTTNPRCVTIDSIGRGETRSFDCEGMEGQYVTVTIPGTEKYLTLCEVQVFGLPAKSSVPNVALEGVASQSTTFDKYGLARNAIDGSPSSDYMQGKCSHTGLDINPWWTVDLRARFEVLSITIINRGDCCEERINGAEIRIGNSLRRDGTTNPRCATINSMRRGEKRSFDCKGMEGRYVTVTIPAREKHLTLCEVQVFGLPVNSSGLHGKAFIFPEETDTSYVVLSPNLPLSLGAFTLCMKVASELPANREIILFSYRTESYDALNVWQEFNGTFSLYLSGPGVHFTLPTLNTFGSHICVTWESKSGLTAFWVNGKRSLRKVLRPGHRIQPQGIAMLGQDPDTFLGSFEKAQSFVGEISDLYMWDHVLSPSIIKEVYLDHSFPQGNIFDWESLSYKCMGNVIVE